MTKRERKMQARFERQQREAERIRRLTEDASDRRAMEAALDALIKLDTSKNPVSPFGYEGATR